VDIDLPEMSGAEYIRRLQGAGPATKCLVFTIYKDDDQVFEVLAAGASGYLLKTSSPDRIMEALPDLHQGGAPMSPSIARKIVASFHTPTDHEVLSSRKKEVLHLMAKGYMYKDISDKLDIRIGTVRQHTSTIFMRNSTCRSVPKPLIKPSGPGVYRIWWIRTISDPKRSW